MDQIGIWRLFIKEKDENDAFKLIKLIDFSNFQIANEDLTLKEVPNIENCHELHITQFALTYNLVRHAQQKIVPKDALHFRLKSFFFRIK